MARFSLVPITETILLRAEGIRPHIKTLDAIHLASALSTEIPLTVVSHDANMKRVAAELDFEVLDPIEV